jgi:monofunctional biosynthetic peptidoglycan transglycosylase
VKRLLLALPLAALGAAWFYFLVLPWPVLLRWRDPGPTAFMKQRLAQARADGDTLELRHEWVPLDDIAASLRRAVIVAEDGNFAEHDGVDWHALREELNYGGDADFSFLDPADLRALVGAVRYYYENRDEIRGRSTITQQLAKNLYFSADRSALRKLEEFVVARRLERFLTKDRILELYLNVAEWGPGVFGAGAAATHYFDRPAAELTRDQAAALAATLPHPLTSNPAHRPGRMNWRKDLILARMGGTGRVETVPLAPEPVEITPPNVDLQIDTLPPDTAGPSQDTTRPGTDTVPLPVDTVPLPIDTVPPPIDTVPPPADTLPPPVGAVPPSVRTGPARSRA